MTQVEAMLGLAGTYISVVYNRFSMHIFIAISLSGAPKSPTFNMGMEYSRCISELSEPREFSDLAPGGILQPYHRRAHSHDRDPTRHHL